MGRRVRTVPSCSDYNATDKSAKAEGERARGERGKERKQRRIDERGFEGCQFMHVNRPPARSCCLLFFAAPGCVGVLRASLYFIAQGSDIRAIRAAGSHVQGGQETIVVSLSRQRQMDCPSRRTASVALVIRSAVYRCGRPLSERKDTRSRASRALAKCAKRSLLFFAIGFHWIRFIRNEVLRIRGLRMFAADF